jgi:LCP family protein required for cell wall assembly
MQAGTDPRPRARSPFVAAFLSLLFPGLGHAYAGAYQRALAFAAIPILILALTLGVVLRVDALSLGGFLALPTVLPAIFVLNLIALAYRAVAIVDAWRVTSFLNAWMASGEGRLGRPRVPGSPLSVAGLLAVILVMSGVHVAVARYDLLGMELLDCIFDPRRDCTTASASPGPSGPSGSEEPIASEEPEPTLSLPPEGSALPDVTAPPWNGTERLNILLIGSDEQGGGHNTDTLIVLSIDPASKQVAMFTLPRDAVGVPIPAGPARNVLGPVYNRKINSLFVAARNRADLFPGTQATRGYNGLKAVLGELYGLDVKYFVEVNFDGFTRVVDALGGVTINVQIPLLDDRFPDERGRLKRVYIAAGVQRMSGAEALVYARSRSSSNDYERGQRQQRVLLSLRESVDIGTILPRVNDLAAALSTAVRTDIPRELVPQLLGLAQSIDTRTLRSYVFAPPRYGRDGSVPGLGFVLQIDVARIRAAVAEAFVVDPELEERRDRLAAEGGTLWVLNGSGVEGQASRVAGYLDHQGFTVSAPNQRPDQTGIAATRIVVYNGAEARLPDTIAELEEIFGVEVVPRSDPAIRVDVVITTGQRTPDLTPPPAP